MICPVSVFKQHGLYHELLAVKHFVALEEGSDKLPLVTQWLSCSGVKKGIPLVLLYQFGSSVFKLSMMSFNSPTGAQYRAVDCFSNSIQIFKLCDPECNWPQSDITLITCSMQHTKGFSHMQLTVNTLCVKLVQLPFKRVHSLPLGCLSKSSRPADRAAGLVTS